MEKHQIKRFLERQLNIYLKQYYSDVRLQLSILTLVTNVTRRQPDVK